MRWYKLNEDHSVEMLPKGEYPLNSDLRSPIKHIGDETIYDQRVSTVFLHLDHNWDPGGQPVLFETMIFGGEYDQEMWRYCTWEEAKAGHDRIVNCLKEGVTPIETI
jgi:hypothetical protein